jgi:hypothetical protein
MMRNLATCASDVCNVNMTLNITSELILLRNSGRGFVVADNDSNSTPM